MSVFYYEPFYDLDRFFEEVFPSGAGKGKQAQGTSGGEGAVRHFKPRMDLHEDKDQNIVTATFELPGVPKEDIHIDVHNNKLTVSAETKISTDHEEKGYAVQERRYGKYSRTLQLPQGIKDEEIKASIDNGVLTLTFPKTTPETAPKKIAIA